MYNVKKKLNFNSCFQPPRFSYSKTKKRACINTSGSFSDSEDEADLKRQKAKKRRATKIKKDHKKRMQDWYTELNNTYEEIKNYDLIIE